MRFWESSFLKEWRYSYCFSETGESSFFFMGLNSENWNLGDAVNSTLLSNNLPF